MHRLLKNRLTALAKYPGDRHGNMALWIGGPRELIGLIRNKSGINALELAGDKQDGGAYPTSTTHIGHLNGFLIFFTSSSKLVVVDLSGQIVFVSPLDKIFERNDAVVCSLSHS